MSKIFNNIKSKILFIFLLGIGMLPTKYAFSFTGKVEIGQDVLILPVEWKFKTDPNDVGLSEHWEKKILADNEWSRIKVPSNWDLNNEFSNYKGSAWYRTSFTILDVSKKNIFIDFGEVGMSYSVFLNGNKIASFLCGNYPEQINISKAVLRGQVNTLAVKVDNSLSWGAYWSWGGIRRPVRILLRKLVSIDRQAIVSVPNLSDGSAQIKTTVFLSNNENVDSKLLLVQHIQTSDAINVHLDSLEINIPAHTATSYVFESHVDKSSVQLWHFDHPHLMKSTFSLIQHGKVIYKHSDRFGIRKIETRGNQFLLNGEPIRLAGYNWVADDRTTGSSLPAFRFKNDIDLMKSAGANMARISHRPLPEDVMDYLDEKGILVLAEFNNWSPFMNANSEEPKIFAKQLVEQNFNHPCVFGWSVGNENGNLKENPEVNNYVSSIISYIKSIDKSHLVTYVSNTADFQENDPVQFCDIIMINKYGGYEKSIDQLNKRYPNKAVFMSEFGSHSDNLIYDTPDKTLFKTVMVDNVRSKENIVGYSLWTFNDYRSAYQVPNPSTSTPMHQNRQWGIVDVFRNKKRAYIQMQHFFAPVKALNVSILSTKSDSLRAKIILRPRNVVDIPSFTLNGYRIIWEIRNHLNVNASMGVFDIQAIHPGSSSQEFDIQFLKNTENVACKVSLLSPTGYAVYDTMVSLINPPAPVGVQLIKGSKDARLIFEKSNFASEYIVRFACDGIEKSLPPTIDHYVDLTDLSLDKVYKIWVVAKNSYGESQPSMSLNFIPQPGNIQLPPIIWLSEPGDKSFFVGYSYHYADALYEILYGIDINHRESWKSIRSSNFSMMQVPGLENGKTYQYQIRRWTSNATKNQWSEIRTVVPNPNHQFGNPKIIGWVQSGFDLILSCQSSNNAMGYIVKYKSENSWKTAYLNQSDITLASLHLTKKVDVTEVVVIPEK